MSDTPINLKHLRPKEKLGNCGTLTIGYDMANNEHNDLTALSVSKINENGHVEIINMIFGKEAERILEILTVPHRVSPSKPTYNVGRLDIIK